MVVDVTGKTALRFVNLADAAQEFHPFCPCQIDR
jgi:hypothetical protein